MHLSKVVGGLNMYHPLPINIEVQRRQREEFQVAKFLSILDSEHVEVALLFEAKAEFGPPTWANQVFPSSNGGIDVPTPVQPTSGSSESITLSLDDYNKLVQQSSKISLQSNITAPTATLAHSDTHALLNYGCSSSLWVIDSRTSYHMTRESSQFSHLTKSSNTSSILLADGFSSFVLGQGLIHLIPSSPF
ncbi:hypothetical protein CK203_050109 [Vitis vinifera]|uniref:Retrovirus-related Pol polyprotein from transposon TNT 1-94-like beta-barrel domain-containing protein n=1 Tax=Vitis vinifera TaxID=29760 RepID=A0A438GYJ5_VITVI|nr:hypothetical protein CK203_050109 [Vitis vinifera]